MSATPEVGPLTHGRVLKIALPIVLSNATVPILGAVDTGVVGQMGLAAPIGAVGIGAVILTSVYWIFSFLRMGTTGLVAQAKGAGDTAETGALLTRALLFGATGGLALVVLQAALFWGAFALAPASDEVEGLARDYMAIRIWGAPAAIGIYAVTGWLIGMERTRGVLVLQFWMNGINIALDVWFVLGLGWGVQGVAVATLIAEWSGLAMGLWLCRAAFRGEQWRDWVRVFDPARLKRMLAVNADIMIRSVLLTASFTTFLFLASDLGDVTLAANQVLLQFLEITAFALDGFAFSAEALVGAAVGARDRGALRRAGIVSSQLGVAGAVALGVVFWVFGGTIIDLMTTSEAVRAEARIYLPWLVAGPLLGIAAWMLDGIYIGATWTREMRIAALQSTGVYIAALVVLLPWLGNHGLWLSLMILNVARGLTLWVKYPRMEAGVRGPLPS
ncbi:MATE family efflux transporter [Psychromarinibacter sp. C21-152]|uniref:MATE family efflux transporter n=1 Tax=Psychromarinibacter sediminicola TaxID=3033385 RepID=A0AAE3NQ19_9RHOB|nr:MATE family efflux transporter [Psychromarinibacter sediminicola]MDF0600349.1 MATE family efflux transporter [Psychromarinibacter sediminicola]